MKTSHPRIERLREMLGLEEKRAALQEQLDALLDQMSSLKDRLFDEAAATPEVVSKRAGAPKPQPRRRARRGLLKEKIMKALESAGNAGVKVKDLAAAIGTKPVNVHSWFHSALKRDSTIKKITGGHYRYNGLASSSKSPALKKPAASKTRQSPKRRKGSKRGELTSNIVSILKTAGDQGISVRDLAQKLGANYKNIYIWFATTGKKNPGIKKLGPARYKLTA